LLDHLRQLRRRLYVSRGIDPDPVIVSFWSGPPELCRRMQAEIESLLPQYRHIVVALEPPGIPCALVVNQANPLPELRARLRSKRIGMAAVLFDGSPAHDPLRRAAFLLAPTRILAYNPALERLHLRLSDPITSALFLAGVPLDRARLRPAWWPFPHRKTKHDPRVDRFQGRPASPTRLPVAILTPYLPWPLSHGGAVRLYHLLKEASVDADFDLYAFTEPDEQPEIKPLLEFCSSITLINKPIYLEPKWTTLLPPDVAEYRSPVMLAALARDASPQRIRQVEYTQLAEYPADVLTEHDITFDLYAQRLQNEPNLARRWDLFRWKRFEKKALKRFPRVVVMSEKDAALAGRPVTVIPNGVDLARFTPAPEPAARRLLFIGSFRHFPNVQAFEWFWRNVFPKIENAEFIVVAGPHPERYAALPAHPRLTLHAFVADVAPLYREANVVVIPTQVSAGTNLKALEAMAAGRAIVSTPSGVAGLGLTDGQDVCIASSPGEFALAVESLLADPAKRTQLAARARRLAEERYGWPAIARKQVELWRELRPGVGLSIRFIQPDDHPHIPYANWPPGEYPPGTTWVALLDRKPLGFLAARTISQQEHELLYLAVHPEWRRHGIAFRLLRHALEALPGRWHLEVRESNTAARALYARAGFRESGRRRGYYENPAEDAILLLFSRDVK
jgi:glycosyltransferase involved in cell wall biosynthesis